MEPPPVSGPLPNAVLDPGLRACGEQGDGFFSRLGNRPEQGAGACMNDASMVSPLHGCKNAGSLPVYHRGKRSGGPGRSVEEGNRDAGMVTLVENEDHKSASRKSVPGCGHRAMDGKRFQVYGGVLPEACNRGGRHRTRRNLEEDRDGNPTRSLQEAGVPGTQMSSEENRAPSCGFQPLPVDLATEQQLHVAHEHTAHCPTHQGRGGTG